jgi:hypothetical protein
LYVDDKFQLFSEEKSEVNMKTNELSQVKDSPAPGAQPGPAASPAGEVSSKKQAGKMVFLGIIVVIIVIMLALLVEYVRHKYFSPEEENQDGNEGPKRSCVP